MGLTIAQRQTPEQPLLHMRIVKRTMHPDLKRRRHVQRTMCPKKPMRSLLRRLQVVLNRSQIVLRTSIVASSIRIGQPIPPKKRSRVVLRTR